MLFKKTPKPAGKPSPAAKPSSVAKPGTAPKPVTAAKSTVKPTARPITKEDKLREMVNQDPEMAAKLLQDLLKGK